MLKHPLVVGGALLAGWLVLGGCGDVTDLQNSFLDPTELRVGDGYGNNALLVPILNRLNSGFPEKKPDYTNADEVRPEDLVFIPNDYVIGPGDLLSITLSDVSGQPGQETLKQTRVTDSGTITVPLLEQIRATGLTEAQLQKAIHDAYNEAGFIHNAQVSVTVTEPRQRTFEITGQLVQPGQYSIIQPDFRLLDALILARATPSVDYTEMFVIRKAPAAGTTASATTQASGGEAPGWVAPVTGVVQPSVLEPATHPAAPTTRGTGQIHLSVPSTEPVMTLEGLNPPEEQPRHIFISGATTMASVSGEPSPASQPSMPAATTAPAPNWASPANAKFEFHSPLPEDKSRIIRIPLAKLLGGDLRYNIVIRPNDVLIIPPPVTGEIYIGGHVLRTGVYSVTARKITLTQAIIMAGMLDPLAIPQRTEIVRRVGDNQQVFYHVDLSMVFAGKQPDILLKPYDEITVGTNAMASFLSAFRTAFRITYGFGYVDDKNFD